MSKTSRSTRRAASPSYELELASLLGAIRGDHPPDRSLDHELLVQETLRRICGNL